MKKYYDISKYAQISTRVVYSVRYENNTMPMLGFHVSGLPPSQVRWIKIEFGRKERSPQINPGWETEYLIWLPGEHEPDGWSRFELSLPELIEQTWQKQGYELEPVARNSRRFFPVPAYGWQRPDSCGWSKQ